MDIQSSGYQPVTDLLLGATVSLSIGLARFAADRVHQQIGQLRHLLDGIATERLRAELDTQSAIEDRHSQHARRALRSLLSDLALMRSALEAALESTHTLRSCLATAVDDPKDPLQQYPIAEHRVQAQQEPPGNQAMDFAVATKEITAISRNLQVIVTIIEELASRANLITETIAGHAPATDEALSPRVAGSIRDMTQKAREISGLMTRVAVSSREHIYTIHDVHTLAAQVDAVTRRCTYSALLDQCAHVVHLLEQQTTALRRAAPPPPFAPG